MKGAMRLAQSLRLQPFEQIGFFGSFSSPAEAVSSAWKKRDSQGDFSPRRSAKSRAARPPAPADADDFD
jgi:hypothetical protein